MPETASVHWDAAYADGDTSRSWYQAHAHTSIDLINAASGRHRSVLDVGGGASTLVDDLLDRGFEDITILDISRRAIQIAMARLGPERSDRITWIEGDLTRWQPVRTYDIWHDRAVLHFLTSTEQIDAYRSVLVRATKPGSMVIIGTFAPDGPEQCSGLPVQRYNAEELVAVLGPDFALVTGEQHTHTTPAGGEQPFTWVVAERVR